MAIDISSEQVVTLTEATRHLPPRRKGKRPNVATLYRWTNEGVRGIRLEYVMVGATRCTSLQSLQRFFDRLTALSENQTATPVPARLPKDHEKRIEGAEARQARSGICPRVSGRRLSRG